MPVPHRSVRLTGIFDDDKAVAAGHFRDRAHVRDSSVKVDRNDRAGPRGNSCLELTNVEGEGHRIHVHENRSRADQVDCLDGGDERVRHRDYFVARTYPRRAKREHQRVGSRANSDTVSGPTIVSKLFLERDDVVSEKQVHASQDSSDSRQNLTTDRFVLCPQVHQRNRLMRNHGDHSIARFAEHLHRCSASTPLSYPGHSPSTRPIGHRRSSIILITRAGFPTATALAGMSWTTTLP